MDGPYYWIPANPGWILIAHPAHSHKDSLDHGKFWTRHVVPIIAPFFNIRPVELKNLPYALPRGRVVEVKVPRSTKRRWVVYHGDDFKLTRRNRNAILETFGLTSISPVK